MPMLRRILSIFAFVLCLAASGGNPGLAADAAAELEARRAESRLQFQTIAREAALSEERVAALEVEIAAMRADSATLTAALIQAAKTEKKLAGDVSEIEQRLIDLGGDERAVRNSLHERRELLAEVLGALQRMGLNPPPALLVRPEDALASVRSAILLGAVVPELNAERIALVADLEALARIRQSAEAERERLVETMRAQAVEQRRLSLLLERRRKLQAESEARLAAETERAAALARQAESLKDLIASLESEIERARLAAEETRQEAERRRKEEAERMARGIPPSHSLAQSPPFGALAGRLPLPVAGAFSRRFGEPDGYGGEMQGDTVRTQSGAIVTAPADGSVLYAGPFRSYGQLLILNAGDGYHVVLAGMDRIDVTLGQSVLAGEPVGAMGETRLASAGVTADENIGPELYIEFRKDGRPVDPSRWWTKDNSGKAGNGS
jgi:septal ring factor EnvC (AmiA/AmiB activator)